jgi:hypothetical protein
LVLAETAVRQAKITGLRGLTQCLVPSLLLAVVVVALDKMVFNKETQG